MIEASFSSGVDMQLHGSRWAASVRIGLVTGPGDRPFVLLSLATEDIKVSEPPVAFHLADPADARRIAAGLIQMAEKAEQNQPAEPPAVNQEATPE